LVTRHTGNPNQSILSASQFHLEVCFEGQLKELSNYSFLSRFLIRVEKYPILPLITSFLNKVRGENFFRNSHVEFIYIFTIRRDIEVHIENMCLQIGNLKLEPYG
jgi:hypothetical protein